MRLTPHLMGLGILLGATAGATAKVANVAS